MWTLQLKGVLLRTKISATFCFTSVAAVKFVFFKADPILLKGLKLWRLILKESKRLVKQGMLMYCLEFQR